MRDPGLDYEEHVGAGGCPYVVVKAFSVLGGL